MADHRIVRTIAAGLIPPLVALALQLGFPFVVGPRVYFLFYPAVFFSSWMAGLRAGLLAAACSELFVVLFYFLPNGAFATDAPGTALSMTVFGTLGVLFSVLHERLQKLTAELERVLDERTAELAVTREAVDQNEARFAAIVQSAMDAIVGIDEELRIELFNEAAEAMFRCRSAEVLGRPVEIFVPEALRGRLRVAVREFGASGFRARPLGVAGELGALRIDGTEFPVEASIAQAAIGGRRTFTLTVRDITERLDTEREIQESLVRYRDTLDAMMEGAEIFGFDWRYLYVNAAMCVHSRRPAEAMLGRTVMEVFPGFEETRFFATVHRCMTERVPVQFEGEFVFPEGETATFLLHARPVPEGILVLTMDVTEQRRAAERLLEQASLLDKAQDAILVRDLGHCITYWNKGAERMYGWTAAEAVGRKVSELLYRDTRVFHAATSKVVEEGEWSGELDQVDKAGRALKVDASWTLVRDADGRPRSILAINSDVTEKRVLEQQYLRAQRMESLGTLAGGIAHDLNNVLAPILLSVDLLGSISTDPKVKSMLHILETSAKHGADMVRQILSFARGVEGERLLLDLRHVVRDVRQFVHETFPPDIEVCAELPEDLPLFLGNATQVHQVLLNLCVNARDAMPDGGTLTVTAEAANLDEAAVAGHPGARPGRHVMLVVSDTGTGIAAADRDRIFDPFFTTKPHGKGTGLGLATVLSIVKSHGGFVELDSEPGRGSTFRVAFPAIPDASEASARPGVEDLPRGHGEAVLVVDDEDTVRRMTVETLEVFGYRTFAATGGEEAVDLYEQFREDIRAVVTDLRMPGMDGRATIAALRRLDPAVRVILVSGLSDGKGGQETAIPGVREFLAKPYTVRALLTALRRVIASR